MRALLAVTLIAAAPAPCGDQQLARAVVASHFADPAQAQVVVEFVVSVESDRIVAGVAQGHDRLRGTADDPQPTGPLRFMLWAPGGKLLIEDAPDASLGAVPVSVDECRTRRKSGDKLAALAVCRMAQQQAQARYRQATFNGVWAVACKAAGRC